MMMEEEEEGMVAAAASKPSTDLLSRVHVWLQHGESLDRDYVEVPCSYTLLELLQSACIQLRISTPALHAVHSLEHVAVDVARDPAAWSMIWRGAVEREQAARQAARVLEQHQWIGLTLFSSAEQMAAARRPLPHSPLRFMDANNKLVQVTAQPYASQGGGQPPTAAAWAQPVGHILGPSGFHASNAAASPPTVDMPVSLYYPQWSICYHDSRKRFIPLGQPVTVHATLSVISAPSMEVQGGRIPSFQAADVRILPHNVLRAPCAARIKERYRPCMQLQVHRVVANGPSIWSQDICNAVNIKDKAWTTTAFLFDQCLIDRQQLLFASDFLESPDKRSWMLVLSPTRFDRADVYLVARDQLDHIQRAEYQDWLRNVQQDFVSAKKEAAAAAASSSSSSSSPPSVCPSVPVVRMQHLIHLNGPPRIRLFVTFDLDKTLLLNHCDHEKQQAKQPGQHVFRSDFTHHSPDGNVHVQIRKDAAHLIQALRDRFHISVLTAGTWAYGQGVVKQANHMAWGQHRDKAGAGAGAPTPIALSLHRVWSSRHNIHDANPHQKNHSLTNCFFPEERNIVLVVDDNLEMWRPDCWDAVYPITESTAASNMMTTNHSAMKRCTQRLCDLHHRFEWDVFCRVWMELVRPPVYLAWAHLLALQQLDSAHSGPDWEKNFVTLLASEVRWAVQRPRYLKPDETPRDTKLDGITQQVAQLESDLRSSLLSDNHGSSSSSSSSSSSGGGGGGGASASSVSANSCPPPRLLNIPVASNYHAIWTAATEQAASNIDTQKLGTILQDCARRLKATLTAIKQFNRPIMPQQGL